MSTTAPTRPRKTVSLDAMLATANYALAAQDASLTPDFRRGVIAMMESALHAANRYRGFSYLPSEMAEPGGLREDYDATRRVYS